MAEFDYQNVEAWNTAIKLTTAVGRLRVGSNLKASADAQTEAFKQAGMAAALIAEASGREGGAQVSLYRDARGSLAQVRSWLHVLASLMNEQDAVFGTEFDLAEQCARQVSGTLRTIDRGPVGPAPMQNAQPQRPPMRGPSPRPGGPRNPGPGGPR